MSQQVRIPIYTLAGGVGRQPTSKRLPSEAQELNNVFLTIENSFEKRSGFEYLPGKLGDYSEDVDLAPNAIVFNNLDLTIGGGEGTETYIPNDDDDFFFNWTTIDENNVFLIGINISLVQQAPNSTITGGITSEEKGSTQDYVWDNVAKKYNPGYSLNFKKKFITVWKVENKNLSLQSVDYESVNHDVIAYIKEGYVAGKANESLKFRAFGTSTLVLNDKVKAGYKELYKTDFDANPINTIEFQDSTQIDIKVKIDTVGLFDGYEIDSSDSFSNVKTFEQFNTNKPLFSKGDIIKVYDTTNTTPLGEFVLQNHKSRFQKIRITKEDIGSELGIIPKSGNSKYRFRLIKTEKEFGGESIRYRAAAYPKSLGYQSPDLLLSTKLIDLNGLDITRKCSRFNPDGADFQESPGCGWTVSELTSNFALGTFWYQNGASTTRVDLNILVGDQDSTIQTLVDIVQRSGGNGKLIINEDSKGLVVVDQITEEVIPILTTLVDISGAGCVKNDNTATRLGLDSYGGATLNPIGVGQISEVFQNTLECVVGVTGDPFGTSGNMVGVIPLGPLTSISGNLTNPNPTRNSMLDFPINPYGADQYGGVLSDGLISLTPTTPNYKVTGTKNSAMDLMYPFYSYAVRQNIGTSANTDRKKVCDVQANANGEIIIESDFTNSPDGFRGINTEGTRFKGTWSFQYPADNRVYGKTRNDEPDPAIEASLTWGIGRLSINIIEQGEGYSTGRFDENGEAVNNKPIKVTFTNMPYFSPSANNKMAQWDVDGANNVTFEFTHDGGVGSNGNQDILFNPQTVLNELGIVTQRQINNIAILKNGISTDITEEVLTTVDLSNSTFATPGSDVNTDGSIYRYDPIIGSGKGVVLRPTDTITTLNHFIRCATSPINSNGNIDLALGTHALTLDNENQSIILKKIKNSAGENLDIPSIPYITDKDFFYTESATSLYGTLGPSDSRPTQLPVQMALSFTSDLKIKYNRAKHQPIGDNIILSTATGLDIGQSVENFSLIPIPPANDDDFTDLNAAEESLQFLYGASTVGDYYGRGKVFLTRESYLTKPSGFYRTVSFEDRGSPFYEQVRAEAGYGSFDTKTMPLLFDFVTAENTWRFVTAPFKDRLTGTLATNPGPSAFLGSKNSRVRKPIRDITFWRDRLWMCSEDNVYSSKVGDYFNLWLDNPDNIVDTDPVDVRTGRGDLITINHLVPFESYMFISTLNDVQFELLGSENQITPLTAELQATAFYSTDPINRPQILGSQVYFFAPKKIYLYYGSGSGSVNNAAEVTFQAEGYLPDKFQSIASSAIKSLISLVDAENQNIMYFYTSRFSGDKIIQNSLHKWTLSTTDKIKSINFIDNDFYNVVLRPYKKPSGETSGQYFMQKCSIKTEDETYPRIDRRISMPLIEDIGRVSEVENNWGVITTFEVKFNNSTGYQVGDTLTFENKNLKNGIINQNFGTGLELKVTEVNVAGKITAVSLVSGGSGYLVPDHRGIASSNTYANLIADTSAGMTNYLKQGSNASTSVTIESFTPAIQKSTASSDPSKYQTRDGVFAIRPTAVNYKVPFGYNVGDVLKQKSGAGSGLSIKITAVKNEATGWGTTSILQDDSHKFSTYGIPTEWTVLQHGKGYAVGNEVTMLPLSGTGIEATGVGGTGITNNLPVFKIKTIEASTSFTTFYDSSSQKTTFTLPVQNKEVNQAIVGLNQSDIGEELTIFSTTSDSGKKTKVIVNGDQRSSNVTSNEDYGQVDATASSFEDDGQISDRFVQESLEYGRLFNFFDNEASKTENWFGTSFTMTATLSEIIFRDQTNNALDGVLNIKNASIKFYKTGKFNFQVKRKPYNNNTDLVITDPFYKQRINSETFDSSQLSVAENGEFMAKVMSFAPNAEISFTSEYHQPVNIANIEFRGLFSPRMSSIRN